MHKPCRECAGTDRAGSVHRLFIVQGPCRDRAGTVHRVFFCCCMDRAGTVQGPCIDCPELNDQLPETCYTVEEMCVMQATPTIRRRPLHVACMYVPVILTYLILCKFSALKQTPHCQYKLSRKKLIKPNSG